MAPDVRFGLPSVKGIRTEVLWEHIDAGEGIEDVAEAFDLAVSDVRWALAYENSCTLRREPRQRPATVRFYFDADVLGLAKVIVSLRSDVTYPGDPGGVVHRRWRPPCSITSPATSDEDWIPRLLVEVVDHHSGQPHPTTGPSSTPSAPAGPG